MLTKPLINQKYNNCCSKQNIGIILDNLGQLSSWKIPCLAVGTNEAITSVISVFRLVDVRFSGVNYDEWCFL